MGDDRFRPADGLLTVEDRTRIERRLEFVQSRGPVETWGGAYAQDVGLLYALLALRRPVDANVDPVGVAHPATARRMGRRVFPRSGSKRRKVYDYIAGRGADGATADEVGAAFGWGHATYSSTVSILASDGWLVAARDADGKIRTRLTASRNEATVYLTSA